VKAFGHKNNAFIVLHALCPKVTIEFGDKGA